MVVSYPGAKRSTIRATAKAVLVVVSVVLASVAQAGIAEFNAAMRAGDYPAAAAETVGAWESYDKSRDSAITIAREFSFVNYLAGDYQTASTFIENLVDPDSPFYARDDQPDTSRVLASLVTHRLEPTSDTREALADSLNTRVAVPDVDNISLIAAEHLYNDDWLNGRLREVDASAALAITLFDRTDGGYLAQKRRAELTALTAKFLFLKRPESYDQFVDLHDVIVADVDKSEGPDQRESLIAMKWVVQAWTDSLLSYFSSTNNETNSNIPRDVRARPLAISNFGHFYENSNINNEKPSCRLRETDLGRLRYPSSAAFQGLVGSVILEMDFDERGRGSNAVLLASIPSEEFAEAALEAAPTFRLEPVSGQDLDQCSLSRTDAIVPIRFTIR